MEPSLDDDTVEEETVEEPASGGGPGARRLWFLSIFLLIALGLGLLAQTDWWTYKRFDLFSDYRFHSAQGEWRRYPHGMVLLVSGEMANTSRLVKHVPAIRVVLLDAEGKELTSALGYVGRVVDDKSLDESSEAALRTMAGLQSEEKRLKVSKLMPGQTAAYQILFVKPPPESVRFRLQLLLPDGKGMITREKPLPDKDGTAPVDKKS
ncbi:MAG: DUF3426 domain-containing protein [Magnetococcales bacterium]|nr:DUF3426 domain-containing protein [Magnetococcales bacterium]